MHQHWLFRLWLLSFMMLVACETKPQFLTVTIYDSPQQVVRLQAISDANKGKGFSHPLDLSTEHMEQLLRGLHVGINNSAIPFFNLGNQPTRHRAFSDREVKFFAPLFVQGFRQATPEEVVTFFETVEVSSLHRLTTSGGLFITGNTLHVLMSNYGVKTQIWQDNDAYEAPFRLRPLEPIDPEPGQLTFEPPSLMVSGTSFEFIDALGGTPWHVAVHFQELPATP